MSVLIKDMEMPKSCTWRDGRCPLLGDDNDCKLQDCQEWWTWQDQYKGCPLSDAPDINVGTSKHTVSATAVEEMLKDLLPERGMWEIEGDEAKNAICETVHDALEGLWKLPSAEQEPCGDIRCEYCHEDSDGYVKPLEKNCHAFIRFSMDGWELSMKANRWHGSAKIRYCPMCGRKLKNYK